MFLERDNKTMLVRNSFSYFLGLLWEKNEFKLKSVIVIDNRFNLSIIKKVIKLFYLHCSCKKVVEKSNKENLTLKRLGGVNLTPMWFFEKCIF